MKKKIIIFLLYFIFIIVLLEIITKLIIFIHYGYIKSSNEILRKDNLNSYIEKLEENNKCTYSSQLFPHPYLGWVGWNNPKCRNDKFYNSIGFTGSEFPIKKSEKYFNILVTGGSVSNQFSAGVKCTDKNTNFCRNFLEEETKENLSLDGRKIKVYSAGLGAYKYPHQTIVSLLYSDAFDLVISIEGFNEHYIFYNDKDFNSASHKISWPANNIGVTTNDFFLDSYFNRVSVKFALALKQLGEELPIIKKSHLYSLLYNIISKSVEYKVADTNKNKIFWGMFLENLSIEKISEQEYIDMKYQKLENYWKSFIAINKINNSESLIILHPVPFIKKQLTEKEKEITKHRDYKKIFTNLYGLANKLNREEHLPIYDFSYIFEDQITDIYTDHSHINPRGNEIMAKEIKKILIKNNLIK
jgi:hypothetical protein